MPCKQLAEKRVFLASTRDLEPPFWCVSIGYDHIRIYAWWFQHFDLWLTVIEH